MPADTDSFGDTPWLPAATSKGTSTKLERYAFAAPAYFPITDFDAHGCRYERAGLVILEGMTLEFAPGSADYELRFVYELPREPVELRLQLLLKFPCSCPKTSCTCSANGGPTWFTITVPVIRIHGRAASPGVDLARIKGSSPVLQRFVENKPSGSVSPPVEILRKGSARLGHGFERVDVVVGK